MVCKSARTSFLFRFSYIYIYICIELTEVRIFIVVVIRTPEKRPNNRSSLDTSIGELEGPNHGFIRVFRERNDFGHESVLVLGVALDTENSTSQQRPFLFFLAFRIKHDQ